MKSRPATAEDVRAIILGFEALIELRKIKIDKITEDTRVLVRTKRDEIKRDEQRLKGYRAILKRMEGGKQSCGSRLLTSSGME